MARLSWLYVLLWLATFIHSSTLLIANGQPDPAQYKLTIADVRSASPPQFTEPHEFVVDTDTNTLALTLHVRCVRVDLGMMQFNTRVFCTGGANDKDAICSYAGPTLRVRPGARVNVTLVNELGTDTSNMVMNTFHSPNITNMHTHGLHIDPSIDSVFVHVSPGESYLYQYFIPDDHAPGNHWYHSHLHGASSFQIGGGLAGAIIVEPSHVDLSSTYPSELSAMHRHVVLLQHAFVDVPPSFTTKLSDPFAGYSLLKYSQLTGSLLDISPTYQDTNLRDFYTTNALYQPIINVVAGEWRIFDLINAVGDRTLEIEIRSGGIGANGALTDSCDMRLIASDGVYLTGIRTSKFVVLLPATRQSILTRCTSAGTFYLQSYANPTRQPVDEEVRVTQNLLTLQVTSSSSSDSIATSLPSTASFAAIRRPSYLTDLRSVTLTPNSSWSISVDQTAAPPDMSWLGVGSACPLPCFGRGDCDAVTQAGGSIDPTVTSAGTCTYESFIGAKGVSTTKESLSSYRHVSIMGIAEEISIWGRGITPHPVHIHVNHMQLQGYISPGSSASASTASYGSSVAAFFAEIGDWRDTWPALAGTSLLRLWPSSFSGEVMIHCHYLKHEDTGMMTSIRVVNPSDGEAYTTALAARGNGVTTSNSTMPTNTTSSSSSSTGTRQPGMDITTSETMRQASAPYSYGSILALLIGLFMH